MGQGQADIALQQLHDCARDGEWLCLKNLHLVTSWLPTLEKVAYLSFRLILICLIGSLFYKTCIFQVSMSDQFLVFKDQRSFSGII